jgi:hypothetical protein
MGNRRRVFRFSRAETSLQPNFVMSEWNPRRGDSQNLQAKLIRSLFFRDAQRPSRLVQR